MEKHRRNQLVSGISIMVIIAALAVIFWPRPASAWDQHVQELMDAGYNAQEYPRSFAEAQAERSDVTFEASSWASFQQQVAATEADVGFVTVWLHVEEQIMWVARYEDTYYYHQID